MLALLLYVALILVVNVGFSVVPPIMTPLGLFAPMAIFVGFIFVMRDFAQRSAGHWVLLAMVVGTALSYVLASPYVALASAAAFAVSELVDWGVYTASRKPFHQRILISSIIATPIDTLVFLYGISAFSFGTFCIMIASKMIAALVIWAMYRPRPLKRSDDEDDSELSDWARVDPLSGPRY